MLDRCKVILPCVAFGEASCVRVLLTSANLPLCFNSPVTEKLDGNFPLRREIRRLSGRMRTSLVLLLHPWEASSESSALRCSNPWWKEPPAPTNGGKNRPPPPTVQRTARSHPWLCYFHYAPTIAHFYPERRQEQTCWVI